MPSFVSISTSQFFVLNDDFFRYILLLTSVMTNIDVFGVLAFGGAHIAYH